MSLIKGTNNLARNLRGYEGLAVAVLLRAAKDARSANGVRSDAVNFLASDGCRRLVENLVVALGLDLAEGRVEAWLSGLVTRAGVGMPGEAFEQGSLWREAA